MEAPTMVLTLTRRSLMTFFMALAMLWAISVTTFAGDGDGSFGGWSPPTCTEGCLQSITWE
ncbi:MAG TPA: hypothetical protein VFU99_01410 [Gaiellaceae bacterium]|nr:hypothetical protein [Gaiellaceae bacterium]